jgi:hypothetical protein
MTGPLSLGDGPITEGQAQPSPPWSHLAWMISLVAAGAIITIAAGHLISLRSGVGFDGRLYAQITANFPDRLQTLVSPERAWRIGPSISVSLGFIALGTTDPSPADIVIGFRLLNLGACIVAVFAWFGIARTIRLRPAGAAFGFVALFFNFAVLRYAWIYPVLADTSAFALGLLLVLAYLRRQQWAVFLIGFVAGFVWQLAFVAAVIMLIIPRRWSDDERRAGGAIVWAVAGIGAIAAIVLAVTAAAGRAVYLDQIAATQPWMWGIPLACILVAGWILGVCAPLLRRLLTLRPRDFANRTIVLGVAASAVLVSAIWYLHRLATGATGEGLSLIDILDNHLAQAVAAPAVFLVAHVVYLGPWLLFAVFLWRRVVRAGCSHGPAFTTLMLALALFALGSESRHLIAYLGFLAVPAAQAVDEIRLHPRWIVALGVVSLLWTRPWVDAGVVAPGRAYFMNIGPRMTLIEYAVFGAIVVAMAVGVWLVVRRTTNELHHQQTSGCGNQNHANAAADSTP